MARRSSRIAQSDTQPVYEMPEDIQPLPNDPEPQMHEMDESQSHESHYHSEPQYQSHASYPPSSPQVQPVQSIAPAMGDPPLGAGIEVKTKFPVARIKRIMQADEDVGKVAQVTPIAVSKALELFMISLVTKAAQEAKDRNSKRVTASHLKQAVAKDEVLDFLADIIAKVPDQPAGRKHEDDGSDQNEGRRKRGGRRPKEEIEGGALRRGDQRDKQCLHPTLDPVTLARSCCERMDFWSRLIGGSRALSKSKVTSPTERLTAFKRACNALQQIWRSTNTPSGEQSVAHARAYIERLNSILSEESRGPAPHPCVAYAASSQVFVTVTKLALSFYDDGVLRSATIFFNTLIDAEVDGVVDNRLFARALVDLVRRAEKPSDEIESRLVELLFGIANNIRLQPVILPAWFVPRAAPVAQDNESQAPSGTEFAGATRKDEFPLFYLLVDYVHSEGRAGDFARTGLLYLIETASRSKNLEKWLIESDLATLMATGLGALYSQLGHLSFTPDENVPHIVVLSDHAKQETALQPTLGQAMEAFMSYLLFWQDTIDHCKSVEVNDTLLDHFQVLFLEQLLYPSLLESSDVAGGSTAAVLTYMCRILDSIDQGELVHRILHFLLASSPRPEEQMDMSASRRKSLNVLAALASEAAQPSPSLFNLRDLSLLGLQSSNRQTVLATLRLLTTVLQRHHPFARALIHTVPFQPAQQRPVGALNFELEQLLAMGTSLVDDPTLNESYDNYVADATWVLESRLCLPVPSMEEDDETIHLPLAIQQDDPIVQALLGCLDSFFTNSVIVNLALTGVFMSLVSSHLFSLDGWVLVDPNQYNTPSSETDGNMEHINRAYQTPTWPATASPTLTAMLQKLVNQIHQWQRELPDFNVLVAARRELLHQGDRPQTPDQSSESPKPSKERPRPAFPGSQDIGTPVSRGRSPYPPNPNEINNLDRDGSSNAPGDSRESSNARTVVAEALRQRLATPFPPASADPPPPEDASNSEDTTDAPVATLGHVLTNVVILYEFILEVSAVVQVRGSLFEEAGFI
ncbi:uncharacterized protein N7506_003945 [Penicillium brevicompactum]|uniref:uncharacterized protein n=1 Tax=Penicillium brevicompactum TaxID=5074 RepID=UPI00253FA06A|nr:uncharacterized protein N7506_003945 [Penicillium brevicompactum]KAJ5335923.1 hypothetical protein N7506_003945 [Penicillium brevicompactum]